MIGIEDPTLVKLRELQKKHDAMLKRLDNLIESIEMNYESDSAFVEEGDDIEVDGVIDADLILEDLRNVRNG